MLLTVTLDTEFDSSDKPATLAGTNVSSSVMMYILTPSTVRLLMASAVNGARSA